MKKLKLKIEDLKVESFKTSTPEQLNSGTVHANAPKTVGCTNNTCDWTLPCCQESEPLWSCPHRLTFCDYSCPNGMCA